MAAGTTDVDLIIRGGRVIDPLNNTDRVADVAVKDGRIHSITKAGADFHLEAKEEFDAEGCIVSPGWVDCHVHCYEYATPLGINPDRCCLARGVTTVVDAGSAGESTFPGFRKYIVDQSTTNVLCFLHLAAHGLAAAGCASNAPGGESDSLNQLNVERCVDCIERNRDVIVGAKIRITRHIADNGKNEPEAYRRTIEVGRKCKLPVMVHHTLSTIPTNKVPGVQYSCPGDMRSGDIYTHTYHGYDTSIIDPATREIYSEVLEARERGVLFDVGHGQGSFSWTVAEISARQGFFPDIISTDLHTGNCEGPVYDMPSVMSKFLHLGMSVYDVIKAVTITPAQAIQRSDLIGSLNVSSAADITVCRINDESFMVEDSQSQVREVNRWIEPRAVWRQGRQYEISKPSVFPNKEAMIVNAEQWHHLVIRDASL